MHIPKKGGLKTRTDANTWSKKIHEVDTFTAPGVVKDAHGDTTLTKLTKAVPLDSSETAKPQAVARTTPMENYAKQVRDLLGRGKGFGQANKEMRRRDPGFASALKENRMSFKDFVQAFPTHLRIHDGKVYPNGINTLS